MTAVALGAISGELPLALPVAGPSAVEDFLPKADAGTPFADVFRAALSKVKESQEVSGRMKTEFAAGRLDDIHGMMIASKRAEIETRLLANVRSKMLEAFQELWRINV